MSPLANDRNSQIKGETAQLQMTVFMVTSIDLHEINRLHLHWRLQILKEDILTISLDHFQLLEIEMQVLVLDHAILRNP